MPVFQPELLYQQLIALLSLNFRSHPVGRRVRAAALLIKAWLEYE